MIDTSELVPRVFFFFFFSFYSAAPLASHPQCSRLSQELDFSLHFIPFGFREIRDADPARNIFGLPRFRLAQLATANSRALLRPYVRRNFFFTHSRRPGNSAVVIAPRYPPSHLPA